MKLHSLTNAPEDMAGTGWGVSWALGCHATRGLVWRGRGWERVEWYCLGQTLVGGGQHRWYGHRSCVCSWADSQTHMIGDSSLLSTLVAVQLSGGFSAARAAKGRLKSQAFLTVWWGVPTSQSTEPGMCPKTWSGRTEAEQWLSFFWLTVGVSEDHWDVLCSN